MGPAARAAFVSNYAVTFKGEKSWGSISIPLLCCRHWHYSVDDENDLQKPPPLIYDHGAGYKTVIPEATSRSRRLSTPHRRITSHVHDDD